jgi:hypothetical protein
VEEVVALPLDRAALVLGRENDRSPHLAMRAEALEQAIEVSFVSKTHHAIIPYESVV